MKKFSLPVGPIFIIVAVVSLIFGFKFGLFTVESTRADISVAEKNPRPTNNQLPNSQANISQANINQSNGDQTNSNQANIDPMKSPQKNSSPSASISASAANEINKSDKSPFALAKNAPSAETLESSPGKDWWIPPHKTGERPQWPKDMTSPLALFEAIYLMPEDDKALYLTFDEGYENGYTPKILDTLSREKVPATFFVTGHFVSTQGGLIARMNAEGFGIGNHTNNHPDMTAKSLEEQQKELNTLNEALKKITGQAPRYYRPPMGRFNAQSVALAHDLGMKTVFWSIAYKDWETDNQVGIEKALSQVMRQIHPGAVILLHAVSKDNADMLSQFIQLCREQGYIFKPLPGEPVPR